MVGLCVRAKAALMVSLALLMSMGTNNKHCLNPGWSGGCRWGSPLCGGWVGAGDAVAPARWLHSSDWPSAARRPESVPRWRQTIALLVGDAGASRHGLFLVRLGRAVPDTAALDARQHGVELLGELLPEVSLAEADGLDVLAASDVTPVIGETIRAAAVRSRALSR